MPFSSGVYTLPNPALVTGEVVSATENNSTRNDLAGALNLTMLRNGTSTATANLPMGGYKLTGLGAPTTNGDALSYGAAAVVTTLTSTSLTATRVPYAGTGGLLQDASTFTFDGTTLTAGGFTTSGAISAGTITASGAITVSGGTANGVAYINGSKVLTTGSALTFDGTTLSSTKFAGALNGTVGATTPAAGTFTSLTDSGNLTFTGTGNRITGDFSNATLANRVAFQSSTAGGNTRVMMMPNSASGTSGPVCYSTNDPANASYADLRVTDGTETSLRSDKNGTGTYLPMTFYTGSAERMRIDTSGNVGIGTSSPQKKLHIVGVDGAVASFPVIGGKDNLVVENNNNSNIALVVASGNYTAGIKGFVSGGTGSTFAGINLSANSGSPYLAFDTNAAERMRIDSSGNLLVGTTTSWSNAVKVQLYSGATALSCTTDSDANRDQVYFRTPSGIAGLIRTNTLTTTYATSSDYRLKENIQPMQNALDVVAQLNPVTYTWKADGSDGQGFIAHELQAVVPDCVTGEKDAVDAEGNPVYQGIDTSFLVATLTKAIQEQQEQINQLKAEVAALKGN